MFLWRDVGEAIGEGVGCVGGRPCMGLPFPVGVYGCDVCVSEGGGRGGGVE